MEHSKEISLSKRRWRWRWWARPQERPLLISIQRSVVLVKESRNGPMSPVSMKNVVFIRRKFLLNTNIYYIWCEVRPGVLGAIGWTKTKVWCKSISCKSFEESIIQKPEPSSDECFSICKVIRTMDWGYLCPYRWLVEFLCDSRLCTSSNYAWEIKFIVYISLQDIAPSVVFTWIFVLRWKVETALRMIEFS